MAEFSVDVETAGTVAGRHSLLSVGVEHIESGDTFYAVSAVLDTPERIMWQHEGVWDLPGKSTLLWWLTDPHAREELPELFKYQHKPTEAGIARTLAGWVRERTPEGKPATFVAWPSSFDKPFVDQLFDAPDRPVNPFHYRTVDIKSYACGKFGLPIDCDRDQLPDWLEPRPERPHHALSDAQAQAVVWRRLKVA